MDIRGEYEFSVFIKKAVFCSGSDSYVELYNMLLRSYTSPIKSTNERVNKLTSQSYDPADRSWRRMLIWTVR